MLNPVSRAHLPAVQFSPRAYMGCGGWDLAQAPQTAAPSTETPPRRPSSALSRAYTRPRRTMGDCSTIVYAPPEEEEKNNLSGVPRVRMGCGSGGYMPEFMKERDEDELGRRRVTMGCGDELCEECEAKRRAGIGCTKCKRIRKRAMMQQQELEGSRMGQNGFSNFPALVTGGLVVFGLFYLATR